MTPVREYKVNRLLWESLEATLLAHGKRLVKDMASTLQVNEKELVKRVFPSKAAFHVSIQDADASCCMAFRPGLVAGRCRLPTVTGSLFCASHAVERPTCLTGTPVRRLQDRSDLPPLWLQGEEVLNATGTVQGTWKEETNQLFLIEPA